MKRLALVVVAGVVLAACGTVSVATATSNWMHDSNFSGARSELRQVAKESREALNDPTTTQFTLHTVCQVLFTDASDALSALPSPDAQANALLNSAYSTMGQGAQDCYVARTTLTRRAAAAKILHGEVDLGLGALRLQALTQG